MSYIDKWICQFGLTHILSVMFVKTFSIVTKHDPQLSRKCSSEMLCSAMYNNNGGSPNESDCQIWSVFFLAYEWNFTK